MSENENFSARNISTNEHVDFSVMEEEQLSGGAEKKRRLFLRIRNQFLPAQTVMIERQGFDEDTAHRLIFRWKAFKRAHLPVVPEMFLTNNGTILVPNLKTTDNEIYGKGTALHDEGMPARQQKGLSQADRYFIDHFFLLRHEIQAESYALADRATASNLILPYDDPCVLLLESSGTWSLNILDLERAEVLSDDNRVGLRISDNPNLQEYNRQLADKFLGFLDATFRALYTQEYFTKDNMESQPVIQISENQNISKEESVSLANNFDQWSEKGIAIFKSKTLAISERGGFSIYSDMDQVMMKVQKAYESLYPGQTIQFDDLKNLIYEAQTKPSSLEAAKGLRISGNVNTGLEIFFQAPTVNNSNELHAQEKLALRVLFVKSPEGGIIYGGASESGELKNTVRQGRMQKFEQKVA